MSKLYVYPKSGEELCFPLKGKKISMGRSAENDIPILDPFCSGRHAFIYPSETGYVVRDNASKNGVFLNGERIQAFDQIIDSKKMANDSILLRAGKKRHMRIILK